MAKKLRNGYSSDLTLNWVTGDLGQEWLQWQQYGAEWISQEEVDITRKLTAIKHFLNYLASQVPYAFDVVSMLKGHPQGHKVSSEEFNKYLISEGANADNYMHVSNVHALIDFIITKYLTVTDDEGHTAVLFQNPIDKMGRTISTTET